MCDPIFSQAMMRGRFSGPVEQVCFAPSLYGKTVGTPVLVDLSYFTPDLTFKSVLDVNTISSIYLINF